MNIHPESRMIVANAAARVIATCDNPIVREALRGVAVFNMFLAQEEGSKQWRSPILDYIRPFDGPDPERLLMFKFSRRL